MHKVPSDDSKHGPSEISASMRSAWKETGQYLSLVSGTCIAKGVMAGGANYVVGSTFSRLFPSMFAFDHPVIAVHRQSKNTGSGLKLLQKTRESVRAAVRKRNPAGVAFGKIGAYYCMVQFLCNIEDRKFPDVTSELLATFPAYILIANLLLAYFPKVGPMAVVSVCLPMTEALTDFSWGRIAERYNLRIPAGSA